MAAGNGGGTARPSPAGSEDAIEILDEPTCWELMAGAEVGRLAVAAAGEIEIFPVNYALDGHAVVFRTAEGTKLVELVLAARVAFEADGRDDERGLAWSVVIKGEARILERFDDIYRAQALGLESWSSTPKERFVRIAPTRVTGRRFRIAAPREHPGTA